MRTICGECGAEIPDGMDFCPKCGCMREKAYRIDDSNGGMPSSTCPKCGAPCGPADLYCGKCGQKLEPTLQFPVQPKMRKNGNLAVFLALVPGFFNIFGLGHLVLKEWSRGIMFLVITVVLWYINGWSFVNTNFVVTIIDLLVYVYQAMDILRLAYKPEDKPEDK